MSSKTLTNTENQVIKLQPFLTCISFYSIVIDCGLGYDSQSSIPIMLQVQCCVSSLDGRTSRQFRRNSRRSPTFPAAHRWSCHVRGQTKTCLKREFLPMSSKHLSFLSFFFFKCTQVYQWPTSRLCSSTPKWARGRLCSPPILLRRPSP